MKIKDLDVVKKQDVRCGYAYYINSKGIFICVGKCLKKKGHPLVYAMMTMPDGYSNSISEDEDSQMVLAALKGGKLKFDTVIVQVVDEYLRGKVHLRCLGKVLEPSCLNSDPQLCVPVLKKQGIVNADAFVIVESYVKIGDIGDWTNGGVKGIEVGHIYRKGDSKETVYVYRGTTQEGKYVWDEIAIQNVNRYMTGNIGQNEVKRHIVKRQYSGMIAV